jgi:hypothetical protein
MKITLIPILALLLLSSCKFFDDTTSIGSDMIGDRDSSATDFEGEYRTIALTAEGNSVSDTLSSRHRYADSLVSGSGKLPYEAVVGAWKDQRSIVSLSFQPHTAGDETVRLDDVLDSLYNKLEDPEENWNDENLQARLTMNTNRTKSTEESYNLRALLMDTHIEDSLDIFEHIGFDDLNELPVLGNGTLLGDYTSGSVPLNITYMHDGDIEDNPGYIRMRVVSADSSHDVHTDTITDTIRGESVYSDTTDGLLIPNRFKIKDTTTTREDSLLPLAKLPGYEHGEFDFKNHYEISDSAQDTLIDTISAPLDEINLSKINLRDFIYEELQADNPYDSLTRFILRTVGPNNDTADIDTLFHFTDSNTEFDYLIFPRQEITEEYMEYEDSVTLKDGADEKIIQYVRKTHTKTKTYTPLRYKQIKQSRSAVSAANLAFVDAAGREHSYTDTLDMILDFTEYQDSSLLFLANPGITFSVKETIRRDDNSVDTLTHSISYHPAFYRMNCLTEPPIDEDAVVSDGGSQRFSRIELTMDDFWKNIQNHNSRSILHSNIKLAVDSAHFPDYHEDSIRVRGIILDTLFDNPHSANADLMSYRGHQPFSFTVTEGEDEEIILTQEGITKNLLDIRYSPKNTNQNRELTRIPETYLYLWIAETNLGRVYWNTETTYPFTYIIQD